METPTEPAISASSLEEPAEEGSDSTEATPTGPPLRSATLKLGDFSSLHLKSRPPSAGSGTPPLNVHYDTAKSRASLGNFSRIFDIFGKTTSTKSSSPPNEHTSLSKSRAKEATPLTPTTQSHHTGTSDKVGPTPKSEWFSKATPLEYSDHSDSAIELPSDTETLDYETPATSTSSSPSQDKVIVDATVLKLCYQLQRNGPLSFVPESVLARTHLPSLADPSSRDCYWSIWAEDQHLKSLSPTVYDNGLHVFLDVSNIHISFLQTLKDRFNLSAAARFIPNPTFNIRALTDFITRERPVKCLTAGCSVMPDRPNPSFVNVLRNLDYRVDVRERKKTLEPKHAHGDGAKASGGSKEPRYVEDYVDETLQTRIGETVMQCFGKEGTLVLVTGDAKPAPYSDGFFAYAERALNMGWHVEVICWNICCSSTWKDPAWKARWDNRFRLIELDFLLDDLWLKE